jgi:hypothetical protein
MTTFRCISRRDWQPPKLVIVVHRLFTISNEAEKKRGGAARLNLRDHDFDLIDARCHALASNVAIPWLFDWTIAARIVTIELRCALAPK